MTPGVARESTTILADPGDPYYSLAEEIAYSEQIPIVHTLDELAEQDPVFLLWVVSPAHLSDQALVDFGLAMHARHSAISAGIISGLTLEDARYLRLRAPEVKGQRIFAVNAENPSGHIRAGITAVGDQEITGQPLTRANLIQSLQNADYLTFTGHGGSTYLRLDENTRLESGHLPDLPPLVLATASCNTFRLWVEGSLPLTLAHKGAAAYAGFAYAPNEGFLIGEFDGVPFRYTWPGFPVGHVVQVQNRGTLQGFAQFPYYYLLGDPRIALGAEPPYRLLEDQDSGQVRTLHYGDAPPGVIPVRIPGGAEYTFVEIPGVSAAWEGSPFYNSRLQMVNIQADKFVLFTHQGGGFAVRLRPHPPWVWLVADLFGDALDGTLLFLQGGGGATIFTVAGGIVVLVIAFLLLRKKASFALLMPAALTGLGFAALHGLYALARLENLTITSKAVSFSPLSLVGTFLLVSSGAFLFLSARSWRGRAAGILLAASGALVPAVLITGFLAVLNHLSLKPKLGAGLWNYSLGMQALVAFVFEGALIALAFVAVRAIVKSGKKEIVHT